jgi:hypothetical protein
MTRRMIPYYRPEATNPELQKIADKAYEAGQEIRKTEILVILDKITKTNKDK